MALDRSFGIIFYASFEKAHPSGSTTENYQGKNYTIYLTDLTDERTALFIGNELQLRIIPNRWDMAWGMVYGDQRDGDNNIAPSDWDRTYASTVLRSQFYLTDIFHVLLESSVAQEYSRNGNTFREHSDSLFKIRMVSVIQEALNMAIVTPEIRGKERVVL